jgi:hypothetical protein
MPHRSIILLVAAILPLLSGCDAQIETYLVHGMVVYPDGKPMTEGIVEFEVQGLKKAITASGDINSDGTFRLSTYVVNDGAIAGTHRVAVIANYEIGTGAERPGLVPPPILNPKFSEFKTSGLEVEVKPAANNIMVQVEYAPPPQSDDSADEAMLEVYESE